MWLLAAGALRSLLLPLPLLPLLPLLLPTLLLFMTLLLLTSQMATLGLTQRDLNPKRPPEPIKITPYQ